MAFVGCKDPTQQQSQETRDPYAGWRRMLAPQHAAQSGDSGQDPGTHPPRPPAKPGQGAGTLSGGPGRSPWRCAAFSQFSLLGTSSSSGSPARELTISAPHFAIRSSFPRPRYLEGDSYLDCTLTAARARLALVLASRERDTTHCQRPRPWTLLTRVRQR